jgi:hypothetical protein
VPQRRKEPSRKRGTEGSNPGPSSGESGANLWIDQETGLPLHERAGGSAPFRPFSNDAKSLWAPDARLQLDRFDIEAIDGINDT